MSDHILLCDFSFGAYLKLALGRPGRRPGESVQYPCVTKADFDAAVLDFLAVNGASQVKGAAISSRGWERKGVLHLPQEGLAISRDDLRELLSIQRVNLVNNFVARALAIPCLRPDERRKICGDEALDDQVIAVLGPHHGLGQAALAPDGGGGWTAMPCEGGHSDLPVTTEREWQVYEFLKARHGRVSREYALSYTGLVELFQAVAALEKAETTADTAEEVVALASVGDPLALEAIQLCVGWLAGMAGDVALILGARGGVYLTGELLDMMGDLFRPDVFCARYRDKGRLSRYVEEIPVFQTQAADMEIIGLATLFDE